MSECKKDIKKLLSVFDSFEFEDWKPARHRMLKLSGSRWRMGLRAYKLLKGK